MAQERPTQSALPESSSEQSECTVEQKEKQEVLDVFLERNLKELGFSAEEEQALKESALLLYEPLPALESEAVQAIPARLQLAKKYAEIHSMEKELIALCQTLDAKQVNRNTIVQTFRKYLEERRIVEELVFGQLHPEEEQRQWNEQDTEKLRINLGLPKEFANQWQTILEDVQEEIPQIHQARGDMDEKREAFLFMEHATLLRAKKGVLQTLELIRERAQAGKAIGTEERALLLSCIQEYLQKKMLYRSGLEIANTQSSQYAALAAMTAQEGAEEGLEHVLDTLVVGKLLGARVKLVKAVIPVKLEFAQHGIEASMLQEMFAGNSLASRIAREALKTMAPAEVGSLLTYMYYLYISEDKTKAMLMYSSFLAAGKGVDGLGIVVSKFTTGPLLRMYPKIAKRLAVLSKIKGVPVTVKFLALMLIAWGFGDELNRGLELVKDNADPLMYDLSGNVIGMLEAPLDIWQAVGLGGANPLNEQKAYLSWGPAMTKNTGFGIAATKQRMQSWDELVEEYAQETQNPIQKELIRLESIEHGPGGRRGWERRQALSYYQSWKMLRQMEASIMAQFQGLKVSRSTLHLSAQLKNTTDVYGDRNVRNEVLYNEPYASLHGKIREAIKNASSEEEKIAIEHVQKEYKQYLAIAQKIDTDRSLYVQLGIFSAEWINEQTPSGIPKVVQHGTLDEILYQSKRRKALNTVQDGKTLAKLLEQEQPPSFTLDPYGWIGYFLVTGKTWQGRIDEEFYHNGLERLAGTITMHIGKEEYEKVFRPLQDAILEQRSNGSIDARTAIGLLAQAYTERYDGNLRKCQSGEVARGNEWTYVYGSVNSKAIDISKMDINPEATNPAGVPDTPMIVHSEEFHKGDGYHGKPLCSIQSVVYFVYDKEKDEWSVVTKNYTIATTQYFERTVAGPGMHTNNAQATTKNEESWRVWRMKHPKFAVQMHSVLQAYKRKMLERETEMQAQKKTEKERVLTDQEKDIEIAKKNPGIWHHYGNERGKGENKQYYEYVAYDEGTETIVFLQTPKFDKQKYVHPLGFASPKGDTTVGMRVETDDGRWYSWTAVHSEFKKHIESKYSSVFANAIHNALAFPIEQDEHVTKKESAKNTLMNILAVYARGAQLTQKQWTDVIEETFEDESFFATANRSHQFFSRLRNYINSETLVQEWGGTSTQRYYLSPDKYRSALNKTLRSLQ
ncbi:MAG: hypothetical protein WCX61_01275 [Candidatus Peribacteraceae bacterium]|jgi:hypothetical protein